MKKSPTQAWHEAAREFRIARVPLMHTLAGNGSDVYSFPEWKQVIPSKKAKDDKHAAICGFSPELMATLCRAMRRVMAVFCAGKHDGVTMTTSEDGFSPMRFDASGHEYEMTGVLMPMRV